MAKVVVMMAAAAHMVRRQDGGHQGDGGQSRQPQGPTLGRGHARAQRLSRSARLQCARIDHPALAVSAAVKGVDGIVGVAKAQRIGGQERIGERRDIGLDESGVGGAVCASASWCRQSARGDCAWCGKRRLRRRWNKGHRRRGASRVLRRRQQRCRTWQRQSVRRHRDRRTHSVIRAGGHYGSRRPRRHRCRGNGRRSRRLRRCASCCLWSRRVGAGVWAPSDG